jgi:hypothetical protein
MSHEEYGSHGEYGTRIRDYIAKSIDVLYGGNLYEDKDHKDNGDLKGNPEIRILMIVPGARKPSDIGLEVKMPEWKKDAAYKFGSGDIANIVSAGIPKYALGYAIIDTRRYGNFRVDLVCHPIEGPIERNKTVKNSFVDITIRGSKVSSRPGS